MSRLHALDELRDVAHLAGYRERVDTALAEMDRQRILARIWQHDCTVWQPDPQEIANRLGWLTTARAMADNTHRLGSLVADLREGGFTHALLLGMGGSSLAPEVFRHTFGVKQGYLDLAVLDSTDPASVLAQIERLDPAHSIFIVSTKSGTTAETLSFFKVFYHWVAAALGSDRAGEHFIAITDPGSPLVDLVDRFRFRATFLNDANIGGRYSALSYFGLVPAALTGMDIDRLLRRAMEAASQSESCPTAGDDEGAWLGTVLGQLAKDGRDKATFVLSPQIAPFGSWVEQLIAESTGKSATGILPVVSETLTVPDAYGQDRLFIHLRLDDDRSQDAAIQAIEEAGHPAVHLRLRDLYDLGGLLFIWEMATAVAGYHLGIHPFNQPDVESAKVRAREMIATFQKTGRLPDEDPILSDAGISVYGDRPTTSVEEALRGFLDQRQAGDYVALQAYVQPTSESDAALRSLATRLRDRYKLATTVGFGPRYLHSTGQLHKGDGGNGLFIQLTCDDPQDVPIPDEAGSPASSLTFGTLKAAQALGDRKALLDAGRRVIRFHLGSDTIGGIHRLAEAVE